jgi:hypothetical protein
MPFVSITRLRSWRYLPQFLIQSIRAARQAKRAAGSLAVSVLRDADHAFWTRTVWRDEPPMRSFMQSDVHRRILARLPEWCDEAALVHWVQDGNEPPSWAEANRHLEGRGSAFEGQSPIRSSAPVRDPRAADERWSGVQVIVGADELAGRSGASRFRGDRSQPVSSIIVA